MSSPDTDTDTVTGDEPECLRELRNLWRKTQIFGGWVKGIVLNHNSLLPCTLDNLHRWMYGSEVDVRTHFLYHYGVLISEEISVWERFRLVVWSDDIINRPIVSNMFCVGDNHRYLHMLQKTGWNSSMNSLLALPTSEADRTVVALITYLSSLYETMQLYVDED